MMPITPMRRSPQIAEETTMRANEVLGGRVRDIRVERFGGEGVAAMAEALGLPAGTWANYENGVTIPAPVLLRFLALTGANPDWLLTGKGTNYRTGGRGDRVAETSPVGQG
jgi:hypothetical protein